jgi:membrane protein required for colicin V production
MIAGILTYLDVALLAIVAVSGLVAMYRGFTREVLSILSWVTAGLALLYFIRSHRALAEEVARQFSDPVQTVHVYIAQVALGALIFLFVLIIVHLITSHISDTVLDSRIGAIDRILGFAFGVVRGFILVVIPYMFAVSFICKDGATRALAQGCQQGELPRWVEQSRSLGMISETSGALYSIMSRYVPSALTGEQQQGAIHNFHPNRSVAPHGNHVKVGLYPGGSVHPDTWREGGASG